MKSYAKYSIAEKFGLTYPTVHKIISKETISIENQ